MFYGQCNKCGERWGLGTASTCKCPYPVFKKSWVGLTEKNVVDAYISVSGKEWAIGGLEDALPFARAIEAKLKEKNT